VARISDVTLDRARQTVSLVARHTPVRAAYLFGSHADGTANEHSDIDIAAFVDGLNRLDMRSRARMTVDAQMQVGSDVELHLFPADSLIDPPQASFAAYIKKHGVRVDV
jgi:predicted nucleotidyltransferase